MDDINRFIGEWLADYRIQKDVTQQELADKLGVTRTAVHYWETGKRRMYAYQLMDYCEALGIDAQELVYALKERDRKCKRKKKT